MVTRRMRTAVALGVIVALASVAFLALGSGASAKNAGVNALPRSSTLYTSGTQWGPYATFNPLRTSDYATGMLGLLYETLFRYDPLKDKFIPWLATDGKWVGKTLRRDTPQGRQVERRQAVHRRGREVHVRDRQARGLASSHDVEDRPPDHHDEGQHRQLQLQGHAELPGLEHQHLLASPIVPQHIWTSYSATEITTGNTATRRSMVGTGPFTYGAGKGTLAARCSGTGATTGGRRRHSG